MAIFWTYCVDKQELEAGEVYTAMQVGATTNNGHDMILSKNGESRSPKRGLPESPLRGRSRSHGRNGIPDHWNEIGRPRSSSRNQPGNGRFNEFNRNNGPYNGPRSPRDGFGGRPESFGGRPSSPPRSGGNFNRRPGSPPRGGSPRGGFGGRPGSPPRDNFPGRLCSPPRGRFNGRPGSPPHNSFIGGCRSPRRDYPGNNFRGRSPPRDDFQRGPPRDGPGEVRGSPRMSGRGPVRSRSRSPPRNGNGFGPGFDQRSKSAGPLSPRRESGRRSLPREEFNRTRSPPRNGPPRNTFNGPRSPLRDGPPRNNFNGPRSPLRDGPLRGRSPGGRPPFDDRGRGPLPMGRPPSPMRGEEPRFVDRGPPGLPPLFHPRGRSRSPIRPPMGDMMRKRDRSWERGGPPPNAIGRPLNEPWRVADSPRLMEPRPFDAPSEWNFELKRSGKAKCRCSATSLSVGLNRQLPLYLDVMSLPHLNKSPEFLQLDRPNVRRVVYEVKPESMADASGYQEFVNYLIQGRNGHARAGGAGEMDPQGFKVFILPPGQASRQLGYEGDHMIVVLRSR
ncbi:hypothetical protein CCR75_003466 [Bremia lactucae]|uniref:Spen paralogue and orthologue SPOC C-terminal domain-containing protein n=1 Tax=Bremia lactucae TaxID=4779 RepID=A0A976IDY1_BRELC|nr:hypothetical protein CCR75_003466 [Bremia lactucae]